MLLESSGLFLRTNNFKLSQQCKSIKSFGVPHGSIKIGTDSLKFPPAGVGLVMFSLKTQQIIKFILLIDCMIILHCYGLLWRFSPCIISTITPRKDEV